MWTAHEPVQWVGHAGRPRKNLRFRASPLVPLRSRARGLHRIVDGIPRLDYNGVEVKFVNMRYINGKLVGFTMGFDAKNYEALAAVLQRQFGKPFATEQANWKDWPGIQHLTSPHRVV